MAITINCSKIIDSIKPMHAVNNGPVGDGKPRSYPTRDNFNEFKDAGIPYIRNHDASFCASYGGEHTVDIHAIFPDFDKDPYDPASYDFPITDKLLKGIDALGAQTFYRLGSKIEHTVKKYGTLPPKDFQKWAVVCEHIIRHYNEGWADGMLLNLQYWEIWNEADLDEDDAADKRTWGGTKAEFFDLYEIAAKHLKKCFPHLKIGGPSLAYRMDWAEDFIIEMEKRQVPMDFFSWHRYTAEPMDMVARGLKLRELLDAHGYTHAESICNEWNYDRGWAENRVHSIETTISMKGAAFNAACMAAAQNNGIDMLMYYDARPITPYNGLFDFYFLKPLKGYYSFYMFNKLYRLGKQTEVDNPHKDIYAVAATDDTTTAALITYFTDLDDMPAKTLEIELEGAASKGVAVYLLDEEHDAQKVNEVYDSRLTITMQPNTVVQLITL